MKRKKGTISLQDALRGQFDESEKDQAELESDLEELFNKLKGRELVNAVIVRVQRYAAESENLSIEGDFEDIGEYQLNRIQDAIRDKLLVWVSGFISDEHRAFAVRCHAQGISTTDVAWELIWQDAVINRLAQDDALGAKILREILVHRLSYLKPGSARWPEKKYGSVWREAREQYKQEISDVALTSPVEQVALLAKHVSRINSKLDSKDHDVKDLQMLTNSLTKTLESLKKVSAVTEQDSTHLSAPQLVAVLERLTFALDAPEQLALSGDKDVLVAVLEQLALTLKTSGQPKALGEGTEVSGQDEKVVSTESSGSGGDSA